MTNERISALDDYTVQQSVNVNFRVGSAVLSREAKATLDEIAQQALRARGYVVEVRGFASPRRREREPANSASAAPSGRALHRGEHNIPLRRIITLRYGEKAGECRQRDARRPAAETPRRGGVLATAADEQAPNLSPTKTEAAARQEQQRAEPQRKPRRETKNAGPQTTSRVADSTWVIRDARTEGNFRSISTDATRRGRRATPRRSGRRARTILGGGCDEVIGKLSGARVRRRVVALLAAARHFSSMIRGAQRRRTALAFSGRLSPARPVPQPPVAAASATADALPQRSARGKPPAETSTPKRSSPSANLVVVRSSKDAAGQRFRA